jgi:CheY-like chemotaxis protein
MVKILFLIDDDQDDREIFAEAVASCDPNIQIMFAVDGVEALEILASSVVLPVEALEILASSVVLPDVIFLDYNMPRMNGLECLKRLKAQESTKNIPTIMYTTSGDREQEKVVLLLGADYYMQKTTSFEGLCKELTRLFELINKKVDLKPLIWKRS